MIGSIFFLTYSGELIAYKELIEFQPKVEPLKFCVSFKRNRKHFPKVIKSDGLFYVTCEQSEVAAVAVCRDETTNAFAVLTSLTRLCKVYQDLFAVLNEDTIKSNIALFYEVLDESFCLGMPKDLDVAVLKPKLCNLSSRKPKSNPTWLDSSLLDSVLFKTDRSKYVSEDLAEKSVYSGSKDQEIFVDLVQQMVINIDRNGSVLLNEIKGSLEVKSFVNEPCNVKLIFSEYVDCLKYANYSSSVKKTENSPRQIQFTANPGSHRAFSFFTSPKKYFDLPFTLYSMVKPHKDGKTLTVELKIYCSVQQPLEVKNFKGKIAMPSKMLTCNGRSSLVSMQFEKNENFFEFHCPVFPCNSHHSVLMNFMLESVTPATKYELESGVVFQFEAPNYSPSKLHVTSMQIEKTCNVFGEQNNNLKRYLRQLTHSNCYKFYLDTNMLGAS